ncbi:MAG: hypothetical protein K2K83_07110 [Rikenella sp.]|nr:hypothetical protein [Rikenella sp.]
MWYVGRYGYSWASSVATGSTNANYLSFNYGGVSIGNSYDRSHGLQLRCLQE